MAMPLAQGLAQATVGRIMPTGQESAVGSMQPIVKVHKISNGFLLEDMTTGQWLYAKDVTGIAELIVVSAAREALGVAEGQEQKEMFAATEMGPSVNWKAVPTDKEAAPTDKEADTHVLKSTY